MADQPQVDDRNQFLVMMAEISTADRVIIETRNAVGAMDSSVMQASEILNGYSKLSEILSSLNQSATKRKRAK